MRPSDIALYRFREAMAESLDLAALCPDELLLSLYQFTHVFAGDVRLREPLRYVLVSVKDGLFVDQTNVVSATVEVSVISPLADASPTDFPEFLAAHEAVFAEVFRWFTETDFDWFLSAELQSDDPNASSDAAKYYFAFKIQFSLDDDWTPSPGPGGGSGGASSTWAGPNKFRVRIEASVGPPSLITVGPHFSLADGVLALDADYAESLGDVADNSLPPSRLAMTGPYTIVGRYSSGDGPAEELSLDAQFTIDPETGVISLLENYATSEDLNALSAVVDSLAESSGAAWTGPNTFQVRLEATLGLPSLITVGEEFSLSGGVLSLATAYASVASVSALSSALDDLSADVASDSAALATLQDVVSVMQDTDVQHSDAIADLGLDLAALELAFSSDSAALATLQDVVSVMQDTDVQHGTDIADLSTGLGGLQDYTESLDVAIGDKADKTTTISAAGLATGGGSLGSDRTITVTAATGAEVIVGTDAAKAITPAALEGARSIGGTAGDEAKMVVYAADGSLRCATSFSLFNTAHEHTIVSAATAPRVNTLPDKGGTFAMLDDVGGGATFVKSQLTADVPNGVSSVFVTLHSFTVPPGKTLDLSALFLGTASATTTGIVYGVYVFAATGAAALGISQSEVGVTSAASAAGLLDGDLINVAAGGSVTVTTTGTATASTGLHPCRVNAKICNTGATGNLTVEVVLSTEVNGSTVTGKAGSIATGFIF